MRKSKQLMKNIMINLTKIKSIKKCGTKNLVFNKASDLYNKLLSYLNFNIHFFSMKKEKRSFSKRKFSDFLLDRSSYGKRFNKSNDKKLIDVLGSNEKVSSIIQL